MIGGLQLLVIELEPNAAVAAAKEVFVVVAAAAEVVGNWVIVVGFFAVGELVVAGAVVGRFVGTEVHPNHTSSIKIILQIETKHLPVRRRVLLLQCCC